MTINLARRGRRTRVKTLYWARNCLGARKTRIAVVAAAVGVIGTLAIAAVGLAKDRSEPSAAVIQQDAPASIAKVATDIGGTAFTADLVRTHDGFGFTLNLGKGGT